LFERAMPYRQARWRPASERAPTPAPRQVMATFGVRTQRGSNSSTLIIEGEADLATAVEIVDAGIRALDAGDVQSLRIDLAAVTFMDSTGIGALIQLRNIAIEKDKQIALENVPERIIKLLQITGLDAVFDVDGAGEPEPA
jgi:anti-anti-sigma factor